MIYFRLIYLAFGLALLGWIVADADLAEVWSQARAFGATGMAVILALYALEFLADVAGWQVTFATLPLRGRWLGRLYLVRMVGEAFNAVTPMAGVGGEPAKVVLLKKYHGVPYGDASASVLLAKTTNLIALVAFLAGGFLLMLMDPRFARAEILAAAAGLASFALVVAAFFLVQRLKVSSRASTRLSRWRFSPRISEFLHHIEGFEDRLVDFYRRKSRRFAAALLLALCNWFVGALSVYVTMAFIGVPVSFMEAWIIEGFAQLVRAATFFIPASIGAQEGAFVLVCATLTGSAASGFAAALVRRFREIVWIAGGLSFGWWYSFQPVLDANSEAADGGAQGR